MQFVKGHWQLLTLTAVTFLLWQTQWVLPLKILVVFFHELAHGLAAILTGGEIEQIVVNQAQGGQAWTRGGNRFAILTAGYLGSLVIGASLLILALRTRIDRAALAALGLTMLLVVALYIRDFFGVLFCTTCALVMLAAARYLAQPLCDLILRLIGLSSLIYVPYDIFDDTIRRSNLLSDAMMLANQVGGTTALWGGLWLVISFVVIFLCLRYGLGKNSNVTWKRTA